MQQKKTIIGTDRGANNASPSQDSANQKGRQTVKSASAFRTISEVADELKVQQHVLRFWESKFTQVKPLKRGGGRRYYRPEDVELLRKIHHLLYQEGYTIKGVQKLLHGSKNNVVQRAAETAAAIVAKPAMVASVDEVEMPMAAKPLPAPKQRQELQSLLSELKAMRTLVKKA